MGVFREDMIYRGNEREGERERERRDAQWVVVLFFLPEVFSSLARRHALFGVVLSRGGLASWRMSPPPGGVSEQSV